MVVASVVAAVVVAGVVSVSVHPVQETRRSASAKMVSAKQNIFLMLLEKEKTDEIFWEHLDRYVIDYLGIPFERDYSDF